MREIHIVKRDDRWVGEDEARNTQVDEPTKAQAIDTARALGTEELPVTVKIHHEDGSLEEERTYPQAADASK